MGDVPFTFSLVKKLRTKFQSPVFTSYQSRVLPTCTHVIPPRRLPICKMDYSTGKASGDGKASAGIGTTVRFVALGIKSLRILQCKQETFLDVKDIVCLHQGAPNFGKVALNG